MDPTHYRPLSSFYTFGSQLSTEELGALAKRLSEVADEFGLYFGGGVVEVREVVNDADEVTYVEAEAH